jgi:hypothetical protein
MIEEQEQLEHFDIDWLNQRYPFDAEARNKALEAKVFQFLNKKTTLTLVDVGAGTGSNCLYMVEQLPQNQQWFLVEINEILKKATIKRLKEYAAYHKYSFEKKKSRILIKTKSKEIEVHILNLSMLEMEHSINLSTVDLVLANAVFDLFSAAQFEQFFALLKKYQLPLYATLNYEDMLFTPEDPFDAAFIKTYNNHMERVQDFGQAMGKNGGALIKQLFEKHRWKVDSVPSNWRIELDDVKMHYYLLNFMENALAEMNMKEGMQANFQKWLQRKKDLIITRQQRLKVMHMDIFAMPARGGK